MTTGEFFHGIIGLIAGWALGFTLCQLAWYDWWVGELKKKVGGTVMIGLAMIAAFVLGVIVTAMMPPIPVEDGPREPWPPRELATPISRRFGPLNEAEVRAWQVGFYQGREGLQ